MKTHHWLAYRGSSIEKLLGTSRIEPSFIICLQISSSIPQVSSIELLQFPQKYDTRWSNADAFFRSSKSFAGQQVFWVPQNMRL